MNFTGPIIAILFIVIVARLLLKKYYPHAVLLIAGLLMLVVAWAFQFPLPELNKSTGATGLDLFRYIKESFGETNAGVGLMIMAIGGFVAYIDKIGASDALVYIAMKPLSLLRKFPHLTAAAVIPIGQLLFVCIPSAAGLSLLLMASIYPILLNIGVSRLSAVSVITACTAFGIGPASAITASAVSIAGATPVNYFLNYQIPLTIPLVVAVTVAYYFVNRYFDGKTPVEETATPKVQQPEVKVPLIYAIIPVLPLILLITFSDVFQWFEVPVLLDTTTAMFISLFVALIFELIRTRNIREVFQSLTVFWNGMGNIFKTVVTLIIAADIFSKGLIALEFIDGLVFTSQNLGLEAVGIGIVMTVMIFLASMLMGSGNAAFFAFAPLVPNIASKLGVKSTLMLLPMNLAASMGRTVSPVAGVLIATAEIAEVSTFQIVKRNLIPLCVALVVMLIYHFI
ncbi:MAG: C4-dicarboxylate ABC transporter [Crocinitomicaceae bacterium]|nr:C4-dicarboxylate ABC transporter [Crocinitomicaceae bacterium]|tara:strand:- start:4533 stop:5897 length:1365 start_codon:yes stop_codon:yes gene_type:complete